MTMVDLNEATGAVVHSIYKLTANWAGIYSAAIIGSSIFVTAECNSKNIVIHYYSPDNNFGVYEIDNRYTMYSTAIEKGNYR